MNPADRETSGPAPDHGPDRGPPGVPSAGAPPSPAELLQRISALADALTHTGTEDGALDALVEHSPHPLWVVSADGYVIAANDAASRLTGLARAELVGQRPAMAQRWAYEASTQARLQSSLQAALGGETTAFEGVADLPLGRRCIRLVFSPLRGEDGRVRRLVASGTDITDAVASEAELQALREAPHAQPPGLTAAGAAEAHRQVLEESNRRLQDVIDGAPVPIYAKDAQGRFIFVNRVFEAGAGVPRERIIGHDGAALPLEADRARLDALDRAVLDSGQSLNVETVVASTVRERERRTFVLNKFPLRTATGEIYAVCTIASDVTAIRAAEHERMVAAKRHELLSSLATMVAQGALPEETLAAACEAVRAGLDARLAAVLTQSPDGPRVRSASDTLSLAQEPQLAVAAAAALDQPGSVTRGAALAAAVAGDLEEPTVLCAVLAASQTPGGAEQAFLEDITRLLATAFSKDRYRLLQDQLRYAQRLESVGKLAGGVAHDFNNLLAVILNYTSFVEEQLTAEQDSVRSDLAEIRRAAERAAELTRRLLLFGRGSNSTRQSCELVAVISSMAELLSRTVGDAARINLRLEADAMHVGIAAEELEQVVVALVLNAHEAMPAGGEIEIAAHPSEGAVQLRISDGGHGMSDAVRERAWDPFFTTKPPGSGIGLGLSTVYGIVRRAGGSVSLRSAPGQGTSVVLELPGAEPQDAGAAAAAGAPTDPATGVPPPSGATILVVDDQHAVREVVQRILRDAGYDVLSAASAQEALALAGQHSVELLLSDVVMPGGTGLELAQEVRRLRGAIPVLYMSGFADEPPGAGDERPAILQKPFGREALLEAVSALLPSAGGGA